MQIYSAITIIQFPVPTCIDLSTALSFKMCFWIVFNVQSSVRSEGLSVTSRLSNTLAVMTSLHFVHQDILFLQPLLQSDCSRINPHTDVHSSAETKARLLRNALIWVGQHQPPRSHKGMKGRRRRQRQEQKKQKTKKHWRIWGSKSLRIHWTWLLGAEVTAAVEVTGAGEPRIGSTERS